jgi:hypothetical protein
LAEWKKDKRWSDKFIPDIKRALAEVFVCAAPEFEDKVHNTDLMVFRLNPARVACRIRRYEYYERYPNDITIRKDRPSGNDSELAKLISGYGDFLFYGFSNHDETGLISWSLVDLTQFRLWFSRHIVIHKGAMPGMSKKNGDNSSAFQSIDKRLFPKGVIFTESAVVLPDATLKQE